MTRSRKQKLFQDLPGLFDDEESDVSYKSNMSKPSSMVRHISGRASQRNASHATSTSIADPIKSLANPDKIKFISFGSGSSGNCSFIGDDQCGFLIDAGIEEKNVVDELSRNGISMDKVKGICLTHDHSDHIRHVYSIVRKYRHLTIYCTSRAFNGIMCRHNISRRLKDFHKPIYKEIEFAIGDFKLTPFEVMHDGSDNVGFYIEHGKHHFVIATDLGCISDRADHYMRQADYLMIECNYDKTMLTKGTYPEYLKARISADTGHLDNAVAAQYVASIYKKSLEYVFLCHLSLDNNTPERAFSTVSNALKPLGVCIGDGSGSIESRQADIQLVILPRFDSSPLYILRKD